MKREDIINAYLKIRTIDNTIPDEVLDFMKNSAIEKLEEIEAERIAEENYQKSIYTNGE